MFCDGLLSDAIEWTTNGGPLIFFDFAGGIRYKISGPQLVVHMLVCQVGLTLSTPRTGYIMVGLRAADDIGTSPRCAVTGW